MSGYRIFKDGDQWCAVGHDFIDLQQSPAGFADTPGEAIEQLMKEFGKEWAAKNGEWVKRARADAATTTLEQASAEYFGKRPQIDTMDRRNVFKAGFESAASSDAALNDAYAEGRKDEREANADVVEALQWAMKQIGGYSHRIKGQNEAYCDAVDRARAALARATGEPQ